MSMFKKVYEYKFSKSMSRLINTMLLVPSEKEPEFPNTPWKFFGKSWGFICDMLKYRDVLISTVTIHFDETDDEERIMSFKMIVGFDIAEDRIPENTYAKCKSYFDQLVHHICAKLPSSDEMADEMTESIKICYLGVI